MIDVAITSLAIGIVVFSAFNKRSGFVSWLLSLIAVIAGTTLLVSLMLRVVPGNPVDHILGEQAPEEARIALAKELGLVDEHGETVSFFVQYGQFVRQVATNQLVSYRSKDPVFARVKERIPYTLKLVFSSFFLALVVGFATGFAASFSRNKHLSKVLMALCTLGMALPKFWIAPLLIWTFALRLNWLPVSGVDSPLGIILPTCTLGMGMAAFMAQMTKTSFSQVLHEDYIRTAFSKGLSNSQVWLRHALRNACLPLITLSGLQIGALIAGSVVTEKIFNWPGLGLLLLESIQKLDLPMVQGVVLLLAFQYVVINQLIELVYQLVDPRLRHPVK